MTSNILKQHRFSNWDACISLEKLSSTESSFKHGGMDMKLMLFFAQLTYVGILRANSLLLRVRVFLPVRFD